MLFQAKKIRVAIGIVLCAFSMPSSVYASLYITEIAPLEFGLLEIPRSAGRRHITVLPQGSYRGNGEVLGGSPQRGEYFIANPLPRQKVSSISIDIQNVTTGSSGIELKDFRGIYGGVRINSFPAWGLSDPGITGKMLYLGAKLVYNRSVEEKVYYPGFDIVVIYE